jgi:hypothetical protein
MRPTANDSIGCIRKVIKVLRSAGVDVPELAAAASACDAVKKMPSWVTQFSCLADGAHTWLYCEPGPTLMQSYPSQVMLDIPAGRYFIDTFDTISRACIARESAQAPPLVIGLACTGTSILLWIRPAVRDAT